MRTIGTTLAALALTFSAAGQGADPVASNVAFGASVFSTDPFPYRWMFNGTNVPTIGAAEACKHYDESMVVTGKIVEVTFRPAVVFLSLEKTFPKSPLTAVVFSRATNHFGDLSKLKGKDVEVSGKIIKYRWMPEIVLDKTNQLVVIERKAADPKGGL